jgi:hypothetical protein
MATKVKVLKPFKHKGQMTKVGDVLKVTDRNAGVLSAWRFAKVVKDGEKKAEAKAEAKPEAHPEAAVIVADDSGAEAEGEATEPAARYEDMTKRDLQELLTERGESWKFMDNKSDLIDKLRGKYNRRDLTAED